MPIAAFVKASLNCISLLSSVRFRRAGKNPVDLKSLKTYGCVRQAKEFLFRGSVPTNLSIRQKKVGMKGDESVRERDKKRLA